MIAQVSTFMGLAPSSRATLDAPSKGGLILPSIVLLGTSISPLVGMSHHIGHLDDLGVLVAYFGVQLLWLRRIRRAIIRSNARAAGTPPSEG
jgi:hypothetical protein